MQTGAQTELQKNTVLALHQRAQNGLVAKPRTQELSCFGLDVGIPPADCLPIPQASALHASHLPSQGCMSATATTNVGGGFLAPPLSISGLPAWLPRIICRLRGHLLAFQRARITCDRCVFCQLRLCHSALQGHAVMAGYTTLWVHIAPPGQGIPRYFQS